MRKIVLFVLFAVVSLVVNAQNEKGKKLQEMPVKDRNSALMTIAGKAIEKYSQGYPYKGRTPAITNPAIPDKMADGIDFIKYPKISFYTLSYAATPEEKAKYGEPFLLKVYIRADNGNVAHIRYIDDKGKGDFCLDSGKPAGKSNVRREYGYNKQTVDVTTKKKVTVQGMTLTPARKN